MNLSGVAAYSPAFLGFLGFRVPVPMLCARTMRSSLQWLASRDAYSRCQITVGFIFCCLLNNTSVTAVLSIKHLR